MARLHSYEWGWSSSSLVLVPRLHSYEWAGPAVVSWQDSTHTSGAGPAVVSCSCQDSTHTSGAGPAVVLVQDSTHTSGAGPAVVSCSWQDSTHTSGAGHEPSPADVNRQWPHSPPPPPPPPPPHLSGVMCNEVCRIPDCSHQYLVWQCS